jgi:hypothetical protein
VRRSWSLPESLQVRRGSPVAAPERIPEQIKQGTPHQFSQFLIDDERPALIHTGMYGLYEGVRDGVAEMLDPGKLDYVILLHFEADENGGMDRFICCFRRSRRFEGQGTAWPSRWAVQDSNPRLVD